MSREIDILEFTPADWMDDANCKGLDTNLFFRYQRGDYPESTKQICRDCTVRKDCLDYALHNGEQFGLYGGLTPRERNLLGVRRANVLHARQGKLSEDDVDEIRRRHQPGAHPAWRTGGSSTELAVEFGISTAYVKDIVAGRWRVRAAS